LASDAIRIKPHHFADIIYYYGADSLRLTPHPLGHAYHTVARRLLDEHSVTLRIEWGADDICAPCSRNVGGICQDVLDTRARPAIPRLKRDYNLLLDQRWSAKLVLQQGEELAAADFCRRLLAISGDIRDIYAEMPLEWAQERLERIRTGAAKYLTELS
jgi:hypothetical protein